MVLNVVVSVLNDSDDISIGGATFTANCPTIGLGEVAVRATDTCVVDGIDSIRYNPSGAVPIPDTCNASPIFVEIPEEPFALVIVILAAVVPELPPINCLSMTSVSATYPDPPSVMVTTPTCPPDITTEHLAPSHVVPSELKSLIP